jgi:hypothetical protein
MHEYEPKSFTPDQEQQLRTSAGPSFYQENFLTQDEFDFCRQLTLGTIDWPEHGRVSKYWGFGLDNGHGPELAWLTDKINTIIPNWQFDFFAVQEAINPWRIHADIRWYADKIPYKVILMPMDVEPESGPVAVDAWPETWTITFDQRNFLSTWQKERQAEGRQKGNNQDGWIRSIDNPQVEGIVPGYHITQDQWQRYFNHESYDNLQGLTIEGLHKWQPRSMFYWDNTMLHCADNFLANGIKTKRSLMLFTTIKQN